MYAWTWIDHRESRSHTHKIGKHTNRNAGISLNKQKINKMSKLTYWFKYLSCSNVFIVFVISHNWAVKFARYAIIVPFNRSAKLFCSDSIERKMNAPICTHTQTPPIHVQEKNTEKKTINFVAAAVLVFRKTENVLHSPVPASCVDCTQYIIYSYHPHIRRRHTTTCHHKANVPLEIRIFRKQRKKIIFHFKYTLALIKIMRNAILQITRAHFGTARKCQMLNK